VDTSVHCLKNLLQLLSFCLILVIVVFEGIQSPWEIIWIIVWTSVWTMLCAVTRWQVASIDCCVCTKHRVVTTLPITVWIVHSCCHVSSGEKIFVCNKQQCKNSQRICEEAGKFGISCDRGTLMVSVCSVFAFVSFQLIYRVEVSCFSHSTPSW